MIGLPTYFGFLFCEVGLGGGGGAGLGGSIMYEGRFEGNVYLGGGGGVGGGGIEAEADLGLETGSSLFLFV